MSTADSNATAGVDILVFRVADKRFGLHAGDVVELVHAASVIPLPNAPKVVEGILNIRGNIVAVLDVRARFGFDSKPIAHTDHFIVAWANERRVAIRADRALDVLRVDAAAVANKKDFLPDAQHVSGVLKLSDDLLLIHDLATFLSDAEAATLEHALRASPDQQAEI